MRKDYSPNTPNELFISIDQREVDDCHILLKRYSCLPLCHAYLETIDVWKHLSWSEALFHD